MNGVENIFVYGTLKKNMLNEVMPHVKPYLKFGDKGYVKGKLYDLGDYPGAKPARADDKKVHGQLLIIKPGFEKKVLKELDEYEEWYPLEEMRSLFRRQKVKVFTGKANVVNAWIYWYNKPAEKVKEISSGIYRKMVKS